MTDAHADLFIEYAEMMVALNPDGGIRVFHDWTEMSGYQASCRKRLTDWSAAHLDVYSEVHVAFKSRLVGMGVQVANLFLRSIMKVHPSRAALVASLERAASQESRLGASLRPRRE